MRLLKSLGIAIGVLACSATSLAQTVSSADALFARRGEGAATVRAARAEYKQLLASPDHAHAVVRIGLLAFYEGQYLIPESNAAGRAAVFDECRKTAATLQGNEQHVSEYLALRMGCTAQWMKYATVTARLAEISSLRTLFNTYVGDNLELKAEHGVDSRWHGGSIYRVLSGIYANSLATLVRSTLPNKAKAIEMADRAINSQPRRAGDHAGSLYFGNYRYKAEALIANGQSTTAKTLLDQQIRRIKLLKQNNRLPKGEEPESLGELEIMETMYARL